MNREKLANKNEVLSYSPRHTSLPKRRIRPGRNQRGKHLLLPVVIQLVTFFGLAALLYPSAAGWFSSINHNSQLSGYIKSVSELDVTGLETKRSEAEDYNRQISPGLLRDPFAENSHIGAEAQQQDFKNYLKMMSVDNRAVMGEIVYPSLNIGLPIYHDTTDSIMLKGAGHLYGMSLPIGGNSSHSVLTSHSGKPHSPLFTPLLQAKFGDVFSVTALNETLYYRVNDIRTVLPNETGSLQLVPGKDLVTLVTCTPIGINTHRFLVTGERISAPEVAEAEMLVIEGDGIKAGFPWWALIFVGGNLLLARMLFAPNSRRGASTIFDKKFLKPNQKHGAME